MAHKEKKCKHKFYYREGSIKEGERFYRCKKCFIIRGCFDRRIKSSMMIMLNILMEFYMLMTLNSLVNCREL